MPWSAHSPARASALELTGPKRLVARRSEISVANAGVQTEASDLAAAAASIASRYFAVAASSHRPPAGRPNYGRVTTAPRRRRPVRYVVGLPVRGRDRRGRRRRGRAARRARLAQRRLERARPRHTAARRGEDRQRGRGERAPRQRRPGRLAGQRGLAVCHDCGRQSGHDPGHVAPAGVDVVADRFHGASLAHPAGSDARGWPLSTSRCMAAVRCWCISTRRSAWLPTELPAT